MQNFRKTRRIWPIGSRAALWCPAFNLRYGSVAPIQCHFKADQFAQQGIVSRISIATLATKQPVELQFRFGKSRRLFLSDDTGGKSIDFARSPPGMPQLCIGPTLDRPGIPHQRFARKPGKQVICFHRKIPKPRIETTQRGKFQVCEFALPLNS